MPHITINEASPMSPTERARRKRERDAARVVGGDLRGLSDTGILEQLARTFLSTRNSGTQEHAGVVRDLLKEAAQRLKEV